ncbi:hypothetical protein tb265_19070 [Gemmatimonadetes bacterium T265]|nr:hypothetical protein tb265_19070 [Gemmatimonadetes bacterium T265]
MSAAAGVTARTPASFAGRLSPRVSVLALRASLGLLLVVWGADKLRDARHGLLVAEKFYGGLVSSPLAITAFGALEVALGLAVAAGLARRATDPALLLITGTTLLAVWRSVLDPLGLVFAHTQLLFFPSLIIFAGALVVAAAPKRLTDA